MNSFHKEILDLIKKKTGQNAPLYDKNRESYGGYTDPEYGLSKSEKRKVIKEWKQKRKNDITVKQLVALVDSLLKGESDDEKVMAGIVLENFPEMRRKMNPKKIKGWLERLEGWKQIDSLCQSTFSHEDLFENWSEWKKTIKDLSVSEDKIQNRAAAVLLTKPVRDVRKEKVKKLSLEVVDNLKEKEDKLVVKALSWLLREMIKNYEAEVRNFIDDNANLLPSVVYREVIKKIN